MNIRVLVLSALTVALALSFGTLGSMTAAQSPALQPSAQAGGRTDGMADMMKMHEQMMADMRAADARLEGLVKEMNSASGNAKVPAIAAVVTELVQRQKAMHEQMGQMHEHMMMGGRGMMMHK